MVDNFNLRSWTWEQLRLLKRSFGISISADKFVEFEVEHTTRDEDDIRESVIYPHFLGQTKNDEKFYKSRNAVRMKEWRKEYEKYIEKQELNWEEKLKQLAEQDDFKFAKGENNAE